MNAPRQVIVIYGNCQAQFIAMLLGQVPAFAQRFEFISVTNDVRPGESLPPTPPAASRAILLWEQYDQRSSVAARDELRRRIPRTCPIVRYPSVGMNALWPFKTRDIRNAPEPGFPWGRYPHGDCIALEVLQTGATPARAFDRYLATSHARMPNLRRLVERERAILEQRDAACDVTMTDFVFHNFRTTYQFWTHGHLAVCVISELISRLIACSRDAMGHTDGSSITQLREVYERYPGQGEMQVPIHPLVIEQLGLSFANAQTTYRYFGNHWTFEEFITRYMLFDRSWQPQAIEAGV